MLKAARRRRRPCGFELRSLGRNQQRAQAAKAVRIDKTDGDELGKCLFDLRPQQARAFDQFVEERGSVLADEAQNGLRADARLGALSVRRQGCPERRVPAASAK